jgi:enoyl-CoA hydratase
VPFAQLGMHAGMATTWLLPGGGRRGRRPRAAAHRRVCDAGEMLRLGLASAVYDDAELLERALEHAGQVASGAPVAQRLHTVVLREGHTSLENALRWEAVAQPVTLATEDLQEGLRARAEKRKAVFTGR